MKNLLLITLMLAFGLTGFSQTNESTGSGNWNDNTIWTLGHEPLAKENVVIKPGHAIIVQAVTNAVAYNIDVEGTASFEVLGTLILAIPTAYNPTTTKTWMDRNLGASQVATAYNDAAAFGDLYQWGRFTEGHEDRSSSLTSTNATTAVPNAGNTDWDGQFITEPDVPKDWLTPGDNTLWLGVSGTNNPCPAGFRLPTQAEWEDERLSWESNNTAGAFGSPLKLVFSGHRDELGIWAGGFYWSSDVSSTSSKALTFNSSSAFDDNTYTRVSGFSVRCIKD